MFKKVAQSGGYVRAICVTGQADFTRSTIENLTEKAMGYGAKGMAWIAYKQNGEIYSILTKYFTEDEMKELIDFERLLEESNDSILKEEKRKSRLAKIRDGLLRMGKVIVKGAIAAGAVVGLVSTLIPTIEAVSKIGSALLSIGVVGQFADSGAKLVETIKAGRAPVAIAG